MAGLTIRDIISIGQKETEKDMHPVVNYREAQEIILKKLLQTSENFISIGYYLKLIRDNKMYEQDGYADIWEFAQETFGISTSTSSRWMKMNDYYSVDGNSPYLQDRYKKFKKSQLQEMLYLTDEQKEKVEEGMTVKEIREIRQLEAVQEDVVATSQEENANGKFTDEIIESQKIPGADQEASVEIVEDETIKEKTVATSQQGQVEYEKSFVFAYWRESKNNLKALREAEFEESSTVVKKAKILVDALEMFYYEKFDN